MGVNTHKKRPGMGVTAGMCVVARTYQSSRCTLNEWSGELATE